MISSTWQILDEHGQICALQVVGAVTSAMTSLLAPASEEKYVTFSLLYPPHPIVTV